MIDSTIRHIEDNQTDFIATLKEAVAIKSVSGNPGNKEDVLKMKDWLKNKIASLDFSNIQESNYGGFPVVYAEKIIDPSLPTVLVYGHYDVQPEEPLELWKTPPFELTEMDDKLIGRGAIDNKGMFLTHIFALESLKSTNVNPKVNIKFIFEGEEESGGEEIGRFIKNHKDLLKTDYVVVTDTYMAKDGVPGITNSLRGIVYFEIEIMSANTDLHSGVYGGAVPNPANILMKLMGSLKDEHNKITIPGFYDDVVELNPEFKNIIKFLNFDDDKFKNQLALNEIEGETGYSTLERRWVRPTLDVHGMLCGFTGTGAKTVIPNKAMAKFSCRLVHHQTATKIEKLIKRHLERICPKSVTMKLIVLHGGDPWFIDFGHQAFDVFKKAIEKGFGVVPAGLGEGGSIPVVETFSRELQAPCVLLAIGNPNNNAHAPNEWYNKRDFIKGIKTNAWLYYLLGQKNSE